MTMPFYVDPEQLTKDRADFARRGVSRGQAVLAASCAEGIVLATLSGSPVLKKLGEVHDRLAFGGVGKYHEFEALRVAAVRWADLRSFQFSRRDVAGLSLAHALASQTGQAFASGAKPLEVELLLCEVGETARDDHIFVIGFDGSISDVSQAVVIGATSQALKDRLRTEKFASLGIVDTAQFLAALLRDTSVHTPSHIEILAMDRSAQGRTVYALKEKELS